MRGHFLREQQLVIIFNKDEESGRSYYSRVCREHNLWYKVAVLFITHYNTCMPENFTQYFGSLIVINDSKYPASNKAMSF